MSNPTNQDAVPPTNDSAPESGAEEDPIRPLQAELERFRDLALRSQADFDNFRKRAAREKEDAVRYANASLLERLLPILDNFELGLTAARNDVNASAIVSGMEMVARQLQEFLQSSGVELVEAEPGTPFDPNVHEAVQQEASSEIPDGAVLRQLRRGFKLRDRLLRAAMVVVSKGAAK